VADGTYRNRSIGGHPHREKTGPGGEYLIPMEITLAKALAEDLREESCSRSGPCCGGECYNRC